MPARSTRELARALGVAQKTAVKYTQRPDWPFPRKAPWSDAVVNQIKAWRSGLQEDRSTETASAPSAMAAGVGSTNLKTQVQILHTREKTLTEKLKREILEGQYVKRDVVDGALGGMAAVFVQALDDLEASLPARFAGKSSSQIERELITILDSYRQRLADRAQVELIRVSDVADLVEGKRRGRKHSTA